MIELHEYYTKHISALQTAVKQVHSLTKGVQAMQQEGVARNEATTARLDALEQSSSGKRALEVDATDSEAHGLVDKTEL